MNRRRFIYNSSIASLSVLGLNSCNQLFRDVKITFKDTNDLSTVVYDTANASELPKILIGKAFEPGDTHNTLSIPLSNDQIDQGQIMAKIQFTIITDTGSTKESVIRDINPHMPSNVFFSIICFL